MDEVSTLLIIGLVARLVEAGCDIQAVASGYCINEPLDEPGVSVVRSILEEFGPRDHLLPQINEYLRRLGRSIDIDMD